MQCRQKEVHLWGMIMLVQVKGHGWRAAVDVPPGKMSWQVAGVVYQRCM